MYRLAVFLVLLTCAFAQQPSSTDQTRIDQSKIDQTINQLFAVRSFREVAISPDGRWLAWVESTRSKDKSESKISSIMVKNLNDGSGPRRISSDHCTERNPAWSHDGKLAYLSDVASTGQVQLYVTTPGSGKPKKLTSLKGALNDPRWAPDGRHIGVLFIENSARIPGPTEATTPDSGVVESHVYEQRLTLIDSQSGAVRQISPADMYVYEYDWSPGSDKLAYTAAPGAGDNNWYIAQLYSIDASTGAAQQIFKPSPSMQLAVPRWSPDGKTIAFISGIMSDEGSTGGEIYTVAASGNQSPKDLTPNRKSTPNWFQWLPSSQRMLFTEHVAGETAIAMLDMASGQTERIWKGPESLDLAFTADGTASGAVRSSWTMAPEVWAGKPGTWNQITKSNASLRPVWGEPRTIQWQSDGFPVQGWLLLPAHYDAARHYPMIVSVHGGPAAERQPKWPGAFFDLSVMSGEGYFVFFPNPRGSYGQGETFTSANVKDFGHGDLRDILSGVDQVVKTYPIDEKRIGIGGWSYGGFMTMWTVTQTNRFRAAVTGAGISNWQSYYGENSIDQWMIPYFGASVYDDPAVYAKSSPITYIKQVKTPTLIVVGERDGECPAPQSYEFWHALKTLGVKTEFVLYPGEGHGFRDPEHILDVLKRTVNWFNQNMPAE